MALGPSPPAHSACDASVPGALSIQQARAVVLASARVLDRSERVRVGLAGGRRLRHPVVMDCDLPPFDRVMMDGYAVCAADLVRVPVRLPVVGEVAAGATGESPLRRGEVRAIMTGAPLPPGADAVVPLEWTERAGDEVTVERSVSPGQHVAPRGEDLRAGDSALAAGELVGPLGLSLLVSSGAAEVEVVARPRVGLLTSGDELVPAGAPLRRGQIRESNGPALAALFRSAGAEVLELGVAADTVPALRALVERALACDVVVLTGGSSVGRYDHSAEVVESFGALRHFDRLSVKPGKPTLFYTCGQSLVFCLPGNPVAALMTGRVLVCAALRRLQGDEVSPWTALRRPLLAPVRRNAERDQLLPVRQTPAGLQFDGWHGSGDLQCMARADAFAYLARGTGEAEAGTLADVFPLPREPGW